MTLKNFRLRKTVNVGIGSQRKGGKSMKQRNPNPIVKVRSENPQEEPALAEAIRKAGLPAKELNVFIQYFYSGKSHREIAEKLGVCKKRVVFLKKKAIKRMKTALPEFPYKLFKERRRKLLAVEIIRKKQEKQRRQL